MYKVFMGDCDLAIKSPVFLLYLMVKARLRIYVPNEVSPK